MSTWILWAIIILGYVGFKKINTVMEKMNDQQSNTDVPPPPPDAYEYESTYAEEENTPLPPPPSRLAPRKMMPNIPNIEGGRLMVETLDEVDDVDADTEVVVDENYSAESIRDRIRDGVVLKEIIDRKYF